MGEQRVANLATKLPDIVTLPSVLLQTNRTVGEVLKYYKSTCETVASANVGKACMPRKSRDSC